MSPNDDADDHDDDVDDDDDDDTGDDATDEKSQMAEECEEEKRRRLEEQFVWPDSPRLSYNGEEDHKNDYMTIMRKKTKTAKLSRLALL